VQTQQQQAQRRLWSLPNDAVLRCETIHESQGRWCSFYCCFYWNAEARNGLSKIFCTSVKHRVAVSRILADAVEGVQLETDGIDDAVATKSVGLGDENRVTRLRSERDLLHNPLLATVLLTLKFTPVVLLLVQFIAHGYSRQQFRDAF
jgi:hypothetical protein